MKQVLYDIVTSIVNNPDKVVIDERVDGDTTILNLHVDESDLGKVIGKQGRIAKAIRTVVKAVANSNGKRVIVDISENED
ncbi:MAG: KH domain-containing protein [Ruminococcaceae bacterium]|nr:KH domain-containing protein [Oscillospiraceae bacterium]